MMHHADCFETVTFTVVFYNFPLGVNNLIPCQLSYRSTGFLSWIQWYC